MSEPETIPFEKYEPYKPDQRIALLDKWIGIYSIIHSNPSKLEKKVIEETDAAFEAAIKAVRKVQE